MKYAVMTAWLFAALLATGGGFATGLASCDSGPKETRQAQAKLEKMLAEKGWPAVRSAISATTRWAAG